jgi:hypothetical protein
MADRLRRAAARPQRPAASSSSWPAMLTNFVAPAGFLVAYLYWFAYVRASAYYGFFGVTGAIGLQFQSKENAADSILTLFSPVAIIALLALAAVAAHRSLMAGLEQRADPRGMVILLRLLSGFLFLVFLVNWLPAALLPDWSGGPDWPEYLFGAAGVLLFYYASHLRGKPSPHDRLRLWASAALVVALVLAATSSYASDLGFERALRVMENGELRSATVYSKESQSLSGPGIVETKLSTPDGYKYRYTGLRLLAVRDSHFILVPEGERHGPPAAILISEGDGVRVEISLP